MTSNDSKDLRFSQLRLANWRNFVAVDVALQGRVFLIGPNASSKSNFLDSVRFPRDLVALGGGFEEAITKRGGVSRLRCLAARRYPDVEIGVSVGSGSEHPVWQYELSFSQDNRQRPLIKREVVRRSGKVLLERQEKHNSESEQDDSRRDSNHSGYINHTADNDILICHCRLLAPS